MLHLKISSARIPVAHINDGPAHIAISKRKSVACSDNQHRLYGQLLALGSVSDENGQPLLSDEQVEQIMKQEPPAVPETTLNALFHLDKPLHRLPQFARRLRTFKAERGL